ncbi:MAG: hypothetical protein MJZ34_07975 [Paludibacteraceae bacterium]|nr:hypothetical protein [Paludibacteraceae bacterium]
MFNKIFNVFKKYEETNEEKFQKFHEFHRWLIENMPDKLKQAYNNSGKRINAVTNKDGWSVELSIKDYLWWETKNEADLLNFKDIDVIKKEMLTALADILDTITLDENDKELYKIVFEGISPKP